MLLRENILNGAIKHSSNVQQNLCKYIRVNYLFERNTSYKNDSTCKNRTVGSVCNVELEIRGVVHCYEKVNELGIHKILMTIFIITKQNYSDQYVLRLLLMSVGMHFIWVSGNNRK